MIKALSVSECAEHILAAKNPTVVMHVRPDGDTVGTGAALIEIFEALGKKASYACADPIPERLAFLLEGKEIARVITDEIFCVDVASVGQLGSLADTLPVPTLVIDHHETNSPFAPHLTLPDASSAGEVLYSVYSELLSLGALSPSVRIAEKIYAAISSDTGCFCFANAGAKTHKIAADLISLGVDSAKINHLLHHSKSHAQILAEGYAAVRMNLSEDGKIASLTLGTDEVAALGLGISDFDSVVDVLRSLRGVEIAAVIKEIDAGVYKASLRSTGVRVCEVAASFGGGGHALAAGCTIPASSIEEAEDELLSRLSTLF